MKKRCISQIKFIILCGILLFANVTPVLAASESEVVYDGEAKKVITPLGEDLFLNFKSMMPGDETEQVISISNTLNKTVNIRLRAENADSSKFANTDEEALSKEILELLELTLVLKDSSGTEKVIYTGTASGPKVAEGNSGINIGSYKKGYDGQIIATLKIPETLGNKYAGKVAKIEWIFAASEVPVEDYVEPKQTPDNDDDDTTTTNKTPTVLSYVESKLKTGDVAQIGMYAAMVAVSGIACVTAFRKRNKNK